MDGFRCLSLTLRFNEFFIAKFWIYFSVEKENNEALYLWDEKKKGECSIMAKNGGILVLFGCNSVKIFE